MPAEDYRASFASLSDEQLAAMEKDKTLSAEAWAALASERSRRQSARQPRPATEPVRPTPPVTVRRDANIEKALGQLRALLVPGETIEAVAVQRRLFALTHRRVIVAATSGRFIGMSRGLLGGFTPVDVRWQDLDAADMRAGIFGADITIISGATEDLASANLPGAKMVFGGLGKEDAQRVYRVCQAQEQAWREKRRVRDLAELRARSGGIQLGTSAAGMGQAAGGAASEPPAERLRHAKEMLDGGLITDAEYESIKARIVEFL
jgi:hypothetical protein